MTTVDGFRALSAVSAGVGAMLLLNGASAFSYRKPVEGVVSCALGFFFIGAALYLVTL